MGGTESKQRLGEKVIAARKKLEEHQQTQADRLKLFESKSPETLKVIIESISEAFNTCAPFLEHALLMAWKSDPNQCKSIILKSCKKVLTAPIIKDEYEWFKQYVLSSSVWFYKANDNDDNYMFEELLKIVQDMSQDIIKSMDSIYTLFQSHPKWQTLMNIKNETKLSRQDDKAVGLLQQKGITDILDLKEEKVEEIQTFIDSNLAVNILTTTAKQINQEFQHHMSSVMGRYGSVKAGPVKNVDRCQSKIENDYGNAAFPKAAKLLDLVRCSVTFNTLDQLLDGYSGLMSHIRGNPSMIELARIKNGFLDPNYSNGYRDIKINVVYHSQNPMNNGKSMICEIQLLLLNYLHEKKRIHKLYSIARKALYFNMVVKGDEKDNNNVNKDMKDLKFVQTLQVSKETKMTDTRAGMTKCSVDTNLELLGMESVEWFTCMNMNSKEVVFEQKLSLDGDARHCHNWININGQKYLSVQTAKNTIKMFKVSKMNTNVVFEEDKRYKISYDENDVINYCEFDKAFKYIYIVLNGKTFEQRSINDVNSVILRIELKEQIMTRYVDFKQLCLSDDGSMCVIGGGLYNKSFYIIDIEKREQYKLTSIKLPSTYHPRFINGNTQYVAVSGGQTAPIEIWDVAKKEVIKSIEFDAYVFSMTSTNNILAVGTADKILRLYDVRNWEMFYSENIRMTAKSLHLTSDFKYITIGGFGDRKCVVLQIN